MKNRTSRFLTIVFLIGLAINQIAQAQFNADGIPFIKNYSPKTYMAGESNWSVAQDDRGIMYFGNNQSILEYDGHNWVKIPVPGQEYIQSLCTGPDGDIYAGGFVDFGKLKVNNYGQMYYSSLASLIEDSIKLTRVWKIYADAEFVYFCTLQNIFKYNPKTEKIVVVKLKGEGNFWSFYVNGKMYTSNLESGLLFMKDNKMELVKGGEFYKNKDIFSMLPWAEDTILIATKEAGLSFLDTKNSKVSTFNFNKDAQFANSLLLNNSIYSGTKIGETHFAYSTMLDGLFIIDKKGAIKFHLNEASGLKNGTITDLFIPNDNSGLLWLTGTSGISTINIQSPLRKFSAESGLNGEIYHITKFKGDYYAATILGVYKLVLPVRSKSYFKSIDGLEDQMAYGLLNFKTKSGKEILLIGTDKDVYEIKGDRAYPLNFNIEVQNLIQSKLQSDVIYAATSGGIRVINYSNNNFTSNGSIWGNPDKYITKIIEDKSGYLWCNMFLEMELIKPDGSITKLPESIKNNKGVFFNYDGDIYLSTDNSIYRYDTLKADFEVCTTFNGLFIEQNKLLKEIMPLTDSLALANYSINEQTGNDLLTHENGILKSDTLSLKLVPSMTVYAAYYDSPYVLLGGYEGLFILNTSSEKDFLNAYPTFIRTVLIGDDSIVYKGGKGFLEEVNSEKLNKLLNRGPIAYKYNNITFTFAAGFYENEEEVQYHSMLEGFDKQWSDWKNETGRTYTNLSEGTYRFLVEAKNIYGVKSRIAVYEFTLLPPWHRTWWAFLIYILIALAILRISTKLYTRKLEEDKRKLEKIVRERTAEIVEKNAHIESQNISITDSIRYAKRIQTAILPNKQTSDLFEYFIYFKPKDIVSGDFYWVYHFEKQKRLIVVAADCTGHGVPGAFMSMLGTSFLNEIVSKLDVIHSDVVLNLLRDNVIKTLNQGVKEDSKEQQKDGMDMALLSIDLEQMILEFSGANNPLILIRDNELIEYRPDKMPIGAYIKQNIQFTRTEIPLQNNDVLYIFSDGFVDQFGAESGRKYMKKRFKELLLSIHHHPMDVQNKMINEEMVNWLDGTEQIDDQLVIGMKVLLKPSVTILTNQDPT